MCVCRKWHGMRRKIMVLMLVAGVIFAGGCAVKPQTAPAVTVDAASVQEASKGVVAGIEKVQVVAEPPARSIGLSMDRLEETLQQALIGSEISSLKRQQDVLVLVLRSDSMFAFDSAAIKPGALAEIRRVADVLDLYPQTRIRVEGHTDSIGAAVSNQRLSERRADAVKNELAARSLQSDRIETAGFGAARPVASNKTPNGRQQNRRIQVFVIHENRGV